jgi:hypothetical protein
MLLSGIFPMILIMLGVHDGNTSQTFNIQFNDRRASSTIDAGSGRNFYLMKGLS